MVFKDFLNQQFDQFFHYSNIQKCILSADSLLSQAPIPQNIGMIEKQSNQELS